VRLSWYINVMALASDDGQVEANADFTARQTGA
jgi:hypothetical protein